MSDFSIHRGWRRHARRLSPWRELRALHDPLVPKLNNLGRASHAGFLIPRPTLWAYAEQLEGNPGEAAAVLAGCVRLPCIVRSVSPTEDTRESSQAGRFKSVVVFREETLADALDTVIESMPMSDGHRLGAVCVPPFLINPRAGVSFLRWVLLRGKHISWPQRSCDVRAAAGSDLPGARHPGRGQEPVAATAPSAAGRTDRRRMDRDCPR